VVVVVGGVVDMVGVGEVVGGVAGMDGWAAWSVGWGQIRQPIVSHGTPQETVVQRYGGWCVSRRGHGESTVS